MDAEQSEKLIWLPRILSFTVLLAWIVGLVVLFGFSSYFMIGLMIWVVLVLTTVIAWKNDPFGGALFVIIGLLYLVIAMGNALPLNYLIGAAPFLITGSLFIFTYFHEEKMVAQSGGDF